MVVENADILSFSPNFLFTSFDAPKLGALNFAQSEWGTSPKSQVLDSTTVIDGQVKGALGEKVSIEHQLVVFFRFKILQGRADGKRGQSVNLGMMLCSLRRLKSGGRSFFERIILTG